MDANILAIAQAARDAWNRGDYAGYLTLYHPDVVVHGYAGVEPGLASVRQFYEGFWAAFPNSQLHFDDTIVSGDTLVVRFRVEGVHHGPLLGIPPTGKPMTLPGITILHFAGDQCVERWSQADFMGMLVQLGVAPGLG
ncbi:MAG: ester cyclase [Chloroflexi bacterium]|nr:MAG: ester cyclase [Chloroflexota bacterium]